MTPERAAEIAEAHDLIWDTRSDATHRAVIGSILAACAEERAEARREALTEAAKLLDDDSRYESSKIVLALRDRKEPTK